ERDYLIIGDMNIHDNSEMQELLRGSKFLSLNTNAEKSTNTNANGPRPYDHVMFNPKYGGEVSAFDNFKVVDLVKMAKAMWDPNEGIYPGAPYIHNLFRLYYSDHHPVSFRFTCTGDD